MELDLVPQWMLWFFGACSGGALLGFALGRLAGFEAGMAAGLLLAGCVSLSFVPRFWSEARELEGHPLRAAGTVVAIEDRPADEAGDVTTPVAIVEYQDAAGAKLRAESRGASGLALGDAVVVVPRAGGARIGIPGRMRGGAIASLLFGTFPFSAGIFFAASALVGRREEQQDRVARRRAAERSARASRVTPLANLVTFAGFLGPILWAGTSADPPVLRAVLLAFGGSSLGLWLHVLDGFRMRRDLRWTLGVAVIAVNFSVWSVALWSLAEPAGAW